MKMVHQSKVKNFHYLDKLNDLFLVEIQQQKILYDKPFPIGVSILEISKWYMQIFYYKVLKPFYGDRMKFLYTDTDSLVLYLETQSIEEDMKHPSMAKWFEDSDPLHKGRPGFMKVEKTGILEFKAYCPKHYYYIAKNNGKLYFSETFKVFPSMHETKSLNKRLKNT
jgi:hypothetical protein